jgi:hypothetical protein
MNAFVHEDLSALFAVPAVDWATITSRAGTAVGVQEAIANHQPFLYFKPPQRGPIYSGAVSRDDVFGRLVTPPQDMPTLPRLAEAGQQWLWTTRPSLKSTATDVAEVSGLIIDLLSELKRDVDGGGSPTAKPFQKMHEFAATQAQHFSALIPAMLWFRDANAETETWADQFVASGDAGLVIDLFRSGVSALPIWNAVSTVQGAWSALRDDLAAINPGAFDPTLYSLEIEEAIVAWTQIGAEATAFAGSVCSISNRPGGS